MDDGSDLFDDLCAKSSPSGRPARKVTSSAAVLDLLSRAKGPRSRKGQTNPASLPVRDAQSAGPISDTPPALPSFAVPKDVAAPADDRRATSRSQPQVRATSASKRRTLFLNSVYGDPANPRDTEVLCCTLNYFVSRNGDVFYSHPLADTCLEPAGIDRPSDRSRSETYRNALNLEPNGACLHCDVVFEGPRHYSARGYDHMPGLYTIWGNFCGFPCAMRYELENCPLDAPQRIMWTQQLASEVWGIKEPQRPAPPRIWLKRYGGKADAADFGRIAATTNINVHEHRFVSYAMMVECQDLQSDGSDAKAKAPDTRIRAWNIRGLRAPKAVTEDGRQPVGLSHSAHDDRPLVGCAAGMDDDAGEDDGGGSLFDEFVKRRKGGPAATARREGTCAPSAPKKQKIANPPTAAAVEPSPHPGGKVRACKGSAPREGAGDNLLDFMRAPGPAKKPPIKA